MKYKELFKQPVGTFLKALKELDKILIEELIKRIENNMEEPLTITIRELNRYYLCL